MDAKFQSGDAALLSESIDAGLGGSIDVIGGEVFPGRGAGGKLRAVRRCSSRKATPYDRPTSGRHVTSGGMSASCAGATRSSSLTSWLVDSTSRLIASSASYFFSSLFRRKNLALPNSSAQGLIAEQQDEQDKRECGVMQVNEQDVQEENNKDAIVGGGLAQMGNDGKKEELDLGQLEIVLKNNTWSREQVDRITELLKARVMENQTVVFREENANGQTTGLAVRAVETSMPIHRMEEPAFTPISEAQRWHEELKAAHTDCMPIEVARAFMGERISSQSGLKLSFQNTAHQIDRSGELQLPSGLGLAEERYRPFPIGRSWARSPATRVPKRSSFLEEEWMSVGPVRRTRQKTFHLMNSSPYTREMPAQETVLVQAHASPPAQSSQTARKILDTLAMLSPSPKGKFLDEVSKPPMENSPMIEARNLLNIQRDISTANGKVEFGSLAKFPSNNVTATAETIKDDKRQVSRLLSGGEPSVALGASSKFPWFLTTNTSPYDSPAGSMGPSDWIGDTIGLPVSSLPSVSVFRQSMPTSGALASLLSESKSLLSYSFASSMAENRSLSATRPVTGESSASFLTSVISVMSTVTSTNVSPSREQAVEGRCRAVEIKQKGGGVCKGGSTTMPFGNPPFMPLDSSLGLDDFHIAAGGPQLTDGPDDGGPLSAPEVTFPSLFSSSSLSTSRMSGIPSCGVWSGMQSSPFPSLQVPMSGPLFGASASITKPSSMPSLTIERSSAPFTFSPPPAPVSCSTPAFSFDSNGSASLVSTATAVQVSSSTLKRSFSGSISAPVSGDLNSGPVFSFTSPLGGPKLLPLPLPLPVPSFTFGSGASPSSHDLGLNAGENGGIPGSGQLFGSGVGPSGERGPSTAPGVLFGSTNQTSTGLLGYGTSSGASPLTFAGQTTTSFSPGHLFGSGAGSASISVPLTFGGPTSSSSVSLPVLFGSGSGSISAPMQLSFSGSTGSSSTAPPVLFGSVSGSAAGTEVASSSTQIGLELSAGLFRSVSESAAGTEVASSSTQNGLELSGGLSSAGGGAERSGRRFIKAKRKK